MKKMNFNKITIIILIALSIVFLPIIFFGFADYFLSISGDTFTSIIILLCGLIGYMLSIGVLSVVWMWHDSNKCNKKNTN